MAETYADRVPLLATKLLIPRARRNLVARPRLIERLNAALGHPVTLVSAPAGFGKTTLVGAWAQGVSLPVAWLSLDEADDDPARFLLYLVAALQQADATIGRDVQGVLAASASPRVDAVMAALINDVAARPAEFALVLDDFHAVDATSIHEALRNLVEHQPPQLHLVIVTREDPPLPLARLRARGQLVELRAHDLRFAPEEAGQFLREVMGLPLDAHDIAALNARTEGWIAGLQLAGLSVRDRADASGFIAGLSGSHRHILSYLTEEVLSRQAEDVQRFLLETSILDKLSGELCDAVTGRSDSGVLLERLSAANLFLLALDDEGRWYRYHRLFAELLRDQLKAQPKDMTAELHRRASRWYAGAGMAGEAVEHAVAAADYATAVRLLESNALELLVQGYARAVEGWMRAIPAEWAARSPRANLAFAWMHLLRGTFAQAVPYVERLQALSSSGRMGAQEAPSITAEWLALQATLLSAQGRAAESMALARQALEIVPEQDGYVLSLIYLGLAGAYRLTDDYANAVQAYQRIIEYGRAAGNFGSEILGIAGLIQLTLNHGQLRSAFDIATQGIDRVERSGLLHPIAAAVYGALGQVHYERHHLEQARPYYLRACQVSTLSGYSDAEIGYDVILSRVCLMAGDLEASARELARAIELMRAVPPAWVREEVVAQQVRLALAQDDPATAEAALKGQGYSSGDDFAIPPLQPGRVVGYQAWQLYLSALRLVLYRAQGERDPQSLRRAVELAGRVIDGALQGRYLSVALEALLLRARMHALLEDDRACLADYARALELAAPEGYINIFVEAGPPVAEALAILLKGPLPEGVSPRYVQDILDAMPAARRAGPTRTEPAAPEPRSALLEAAAIEPLTERELEVLRLMAEDLTYEEVARRLVVSVNTVRFHVKGLYGKLGVAKRMAAIARARELGLLGGG